MMLRDQYGVTLVELLVTMALIGVLTAIAIPVYMDQLPSLRLKASIRRIASVLALSRMAAVSNNVPCRVVFVPAQGYYYAFLDMNGNGVANAGEIAATGLDIVDIGGGLGGVLIPNTVSFGPSAGVGGLPVLSGTPSTPPSNGVALPGNTVIFDPKGTTNATGNSEAVYLRNTKGQCMAVRITYPGFTQVYTWTGSSWQ